MFEINTLTIYLPEFFKNNYLLIKKTVILCKIKFSYLYLACCTIASKCDAGLSNINLMKLLPRVFLCTTRSLPSEHLEVSPFNKDRTASNGFRDCISISDLTLCAPVHYKDCRTS